MTHSVPTRVPREALASPWQRLGAFLLDIAVVGLAYAAVLLFSLDREDLKRLVPSDDHPWDWFVSLAWYAYLVVPTALWGGTLGQYAVGIRVCSRRDLGRPGWIRSLKRYGIFYVVGSIPFVGGLLSLFIPLPLFWTTDRQGLHDLFADTVVIRDGSAADGVSRP